MAEIKKRVLILSSGKQIKLFGTGIGIGKSLEIGECYAPNILAISVGAGSNDITNTHGLSLDEVFEIADLNIRLWVELKDNIRKHGLGLKIFRTGD